MQQKLNAHHDEDSKSYFLKTCIATLGIVFGDIGTSPLYAVRECFTGEHGLVLSNANILGIMSLIFWSLVLVICLKYVMIVVKADNKGEGGILALMSLVLPKLKERANLKRLYLVTIVFGMFGASLLYGDGVITPAISVLSAVEGLQMVSPAFQKFIIPLTVIILVLFFSMQHRGTAKIGMFFGPVMLLWFGSLGYFGLKEIIHFPRIFESLNPILGASLFWHEKWKAFVIIGTVFLVVTGGEALYADLGHFSKKPIRTVWFLFVLPALVLNYFGQGALLMQNPKALMNPFYSLVPTPLLYPMIILATFSTVIASQAVVSGVFSLTRQAVIFGYLPRMLIKHTSYKEIGQIYLPGINFVMLILTLFLVFFFRSSGQLAAAYGLAVSLTMLITTFLIFLLSQLIWKTPKFISIVLLVIFLSIDLTFCVSNLLKIESGGWFPLLAGLFVFTLMMTWKKGKEILRNRIKEYLGDLEEYLNEINQKGLHLVDGLAIYMTSSTQYAPTPFVQNVVHNKILHKKIIFLTIQTQEVPHMSNLEKVKVEKLQANIFRVVCHTGFMQVPDIPSLLKLIETQLDFPIDLKQTTFILGRETLIATERPGMAIWRENLFATMAKNALRATAYFNIPRHRVLEMGIQIEL